MKRSKLIKHLESHGCFFVREGAKHSMYGNPEGVTAIPRHSEIGDRLAEKICKELNVPKIRRSK